MNEDECYFTGFCFVTNEQRMVEADFTADGRAETDCCYENCDYRTRCAVGREIANHLLNSQK